MAQGPLPWAAGLWAWTRPRGPQRLLGPQAYFAAVMRIRCACAVRYARSVLVAPFLDSEEPPTHLRLATSG
jgi:hypothetical protein